MRNLRFEINHYVAGDGSMIELILQVYPELADGHSRTVCNSIHQ